MAVIRRMKLESGAVRHQEETPSGGWKFISKDRYTELRKAGATVRKTKMPTERDESSDTTSARPARRSNKGKGKSKESSGSSNDRRLLDDLFANMRY